MYKYDFNDCNDDIYQYEEVVTEDILNYLTYDFDWYNCLHYVTGHDNIIDYITEMCINNDSITGNPSGSYTVNRYAAESCLCHNTYLLQDALEELGYTDVPTDPETCDVIIRCYLVPQALETCLQEESIQDTINSIYEEMGEEC